MDQEVDVRQIRDRRRWHPDRTTSTGCHPLLSLSTCPLCLLGHVLPQEMVEVQGDPLAVGRLMEGKTKYFPFPPNITCSTACFGAVAGERVELGSRSLTIHRGASGQQGWAH